MAFASIEWWAERTISEYSRAATTAVEIGIVLVGTLAFRPIHQRVESAVDSIFTRRRRRARAQLYRLAREMPSFKDRTQLMRRVLEAIDHYLQASGSAIYLNDEKYVATASTFDSRLDAVPPDDPLVIRLQSSSSPANPRALQSKAAGSIACPMMAGGALIGFLVVASRQGEYEPEDRQILAGLAESAGVALAYIDPSLAARNDERSERGNLPAEIASFIGRAQEIAAVGKLLETHRLICMKGPGGIGKSRLALRAAHEHRRKWPQTGTWLVDLSPAVRAEEVLYTLAKTIGVPQNSAKSELESVERFLQSRPNLIVLDNCEHLVAAAARLSFELLAHCPQLRLVATSREPLSIAGEAVYTVPPLPPDQSLALFRERAAEVGANIGDAQQVVPDVLTVLRHLDGVPFAIELAAARLRLMSARELAAGLAGRLQLLTAQNRMASPRQQTLRATIDWSYCLLSSEEKLLFRRMAVFPYTFDAGAIAAICATAPLSESGAVALLGLLVDKSLVQTEPGPDGQRFRFLEATRAFAGELCDPGDLQALKQRHARYFAGVAARLADPNVPDSDARMRQVHTDAENVYAAMEWGLAEDDLQISVQIAQSLRLFWFHYAQLRTGREWISRILESEPDLDAEQRAAMHIGRAIVSEFSDPAGSLQDAQLAVDLYRTHSDAAALAQSLTVLGIAQRSLGMYEQARASYEESMAIYERLGSERANTVAGTLAALLTDCCPDEFDFAQVLYDRCLQSARRTGRRGIEGVMLGNMAQLALLREDYASAYDCSKQSVDIARTLDAAAVLATFLTVLASAARASGKVDEARACMAEALHIFGAIGDDDPEHTSAALDAAVEFLAGEAQFVQATELYQLTQAYRQRHRAIRAPTMQARLSRIIAPLQTLGPANPRAAESSPAAEVVARALDLLCAR
ncbi:MAG: GAF domain-containing protein [Candidatus Eremiobacteraeota bacterium]|nr:GAF domain-containing protein [Candidatus Eremiobacteraeota bacterium]